MFTLQRRIEAGKTVIVGWAGAVFAGGIQYQEVGLRFRPRDAMEAEEMILKLFPKEYDTVAWRIMPEVSKHEKKFTLYMRLVLLNKSQQVFVNLKSAEGAALPVYDKIVGFA